MERPLGGSGGAFSDREIAGIRRQLSVAPKQARCPRCGSILVVAGPVRLGVVPVWRVHCGACGGAMTVRAVERRPVPPAFDTLVVSNPSGRKGKAAAGGLALSVVLHGALVVGAVIATTGAASHGPNREAAADTTLVFLAANEEPPPPPEEAAPRRLATLNPPAKGFQTLTVPHDVPLRFPEIDLRARFDPRDYSGRGVEGGIFDGVIEGSVDASQAFLEAVVDERPEYLSGPGLRYPHALRDAGIEGYVLAEFVIDTLGRAEAESIRVLTSTVEAFEAPALDAIRGSRYRPGRVRGVAVRVLVRQRLEFSVGRRMP